MLLTPIVHSAASLFIFTAIAHSYLGERYIIARLLSKKENLPSIKGSKVFTGDTIRFAWHLTSVAWLTLAVLLLFLGLNKLTPVVALRLIAGSAILSGLISLIIARGRHLSYIVFMIIAGLLFYGATILN
ncbi:MAG: hypothetical protein J5I59_09950 [Saprospiraceae bacterium]|nr:hypothetical protein [Saprospiraceae bacterium]